MSKEQSVAFIQLKGEPYQRRVAHAGGAEEVIDVNTTLNNLSRNTGYAETLPQKICEAAGEMTVLFDQGGYYDIDRKIKHGEELSFDESFSLGAFVCSALNNPLRAELVPNYTVVSPHETHLQQATALLSAMSAKESYVGLTPEEIAGVVAATVELDTVIRTPAATPILSFGGMGGDRGYPRNGDNSKLFSLSTLSAVALSAEGLVHKHHSYPNTSKVAGQSAIEAFGARSDFHSAEAFEGVMAESQVMMSSCHDTRTLHTLSHLLRGETINHVIGPLAFTMAKDAPIQAFIGVNEKVHPETIIETLKLLTQKGVQHYENSVAYCGTDLTDVLGTMTQPDTYLKDRAAKRHVVLDEVAPPPYTTMAAFLRGGENTGTYVLYPEDFYPEVVLEDISFTDLLIKNAPDAIMQSNRDVLAGRDTSKMRYLAMTMGLGLFVRHALDRDDALDPQTRRVNPVYLRQCTDEAFALLTSGKAAAKMEQYVATTQRYAGKGNHETA